MGSCSSNKNKIISEEFYDSGNIKSRVYLVEENLRDTVLFVEQYEKDGFLKSSGNANSNGLRIHLGLVHQ
jgi:hypothetical protein